MDPESSISKKTLGSTEVAVDNGVVLRFKVPAETILDINHKVAIRSGNRADNLVHDMAVLHIRVLRPSRSVKPFYEGGL